MLKITTCLWFDDQAEEAVKFYTSVFKNSSTGSTSRYDENSAKASGRSVGSVLVINFEIEGSHFMALNGGPMFKINPSVSFMVYCNNESEVRTLWQKLSDGGNAIMPLDKYPWSPLYGWISDRYGVNWQVFHVNSPYTGPKIVPSLLFTAAQTGRAEEALKYYTSVFPNSKIEDIQKFEPADKAGLEMTGKVKYSRFEIENSPFIAMDGGAAHEFTFNEAVSFMINCDNQAEIDKYWNTLTSDGGEESMCGWLKDKYGLSWQVVPVQLGKLMSSNEPGKAQRAMAALLQMRKLDIKTLEAA